MWTATIGFTVAFDSITHKSIWNVFESCGIEHDYISLLRKIYRDQKASVQTDEKSNMFEIKKRTKQGDLLSSLLFNIVLQNSLKEVTQRWQKKKRNGNLLERPRSRLPHKLEVRRRRATVRNIQRTASKNDVRIQGKYWKSEIRIHPGKTKVLSNQSSISLDSKKRSANRRCQNWNPDKKWKREIRRPADYIPASRNDRNQESYQDSLGDVSQIQAGADFKKTTCSNTVSDCSTQQ